MVRHCTSFWTPLCSIFLNLKNLYFSRGSMSKKNIFLYNFRCSLRSGVSGPHLSVACFQGTRRTPRPEVIVGAQCCNNVNRSHCWNTSFQQCEPEPLLEHIVATMWTGAIVGTHCCNNVNRSHCWNTWLQQCGPESLLAHSVAIMWTGAIVGTHCCNSVNRSHCWLTFLQQLLWITLLQQWPWAPLLP
jgi:hypothetical protein